jgi:hypothetical protein
VLVVRSLKLGSVETGRELLETGFIPAIAVSELVDVETFDAPVEKDQNINLVVENVAYRDAFVEGVLLGVEA